MAHFRKIPAAAAAPSDVDDVIQAKGLMDRGFLMKLAQLSVSSTEQFQMGIFLSLKTSKIQELMRASEDAVTNTYTLLETWIDSRKDVSNSPALFDQLSGAFQNIKRADMVEFVRCEQLHLLNEKLKRAKETVQSCKTRSNEQMRLVKVELRETKEELQKSNDLLRLEQSKCQTSEDEIRRLNELVTRSGNQEKATPALSGTRIKTHKVASISPALPVTDRIKALKVAAGAVKGESDKDRKLRALHVMSMLRGYIQPELWGHVSQHFVKEGHLDLSEVLSSTNLPDLLYLLQSGAASDVTELNMGVNTVFAGEEAGRVFGAALAKMSTLCELNLRRCSLTDRSWVHIADGIIRGCLQLKTLVCWFNSLTNDSEETMRRLLTQLPHLKIWAIGCGLTRPSVDRLKVEFAGRFHL